MHVNRPIKKLIALALAATAGVAATQVGAQPVSAQARDKLPCATSPQPGYPDAVPPILAPIPCSELAALRGAERQEGQKFFYRLPPTARYSDVEMNFYASLYASGGNGGS